MSVARVGTATRIAFTGVNLQTGDFAMWVPEGDEAGCESVRATRSATTMLGDVRATGVEPASRCLAWTLAHQMVEAC